jgi:hypothetical protein
MLDSNQLDVKKIRSAIKEAHQTKKVNLKNIDVIYIRSFHQGEKLKWWNVPGMAHVPRTYSAYPSLADYMTILYSLRAHSHGKLHIQKQWLPNRIDGNLILVERDMKDQSDLIEPYAIKFMKESHDADAEFAKFSKSLVEEIPKPKGFFQKLFGGSK